MKAKKLLRFKRVGFSGVLLLLGTLGNLNTAVACGPGDHWVDTCSTGTDVFDSTAAVGIDTNLDGKSDFILNLSGPTTVLRGDPQNTPDPLDLLSPYLAPNPIGHFNRIPTEIKSISLTGSGYTLRAGSDQIALGANQITGPSVGAILEKTAGNPSAIDLAAGVVAGSLAPVDPKLAFSYFNINFQIDTPFGSLHNVTPLKLQTVIDRTPPVGFSYLHTNYAPVKLYDSSGVVRAQLINASHNPCGSKGDCSAPVCSVTITPASGSNPRTYATVTLQDIKRGADSAASGLSSIREWGTNVTFNIPAFSLGTTSPESVVATKISETPATFSVGASDVVGNSMVCDPTITTLFVTKGNQVQQTLTGISQDESFVSIQNNEAGIKNVDIKVNNQTIRVSHLLDNETRVINLASILLVGNNTITLTGYGHEGDGAGIAIGDSSLLPAPKGVSKLLAVNSTKEDSAQLKFTQIPQQQNLLSIYSSEPAFNELLIDVNGAQLMEISVGKNEVMRTVDLSSSMMNLKKGNSIHLSGEGQLGTSAVISVSEQPTKP
ncbi:MAG: hypothetical protein WCG16_12260 [Methylococcales bacterium]